MKYFIGKVEYKTTRHDLHKHKGYEILYYTSGNGILSANGEYRVQEGDIVIIPPGVSHASTSLNNLRCVYVNGENSGLLNFNSPVLTKDNENKEGKTLCELIYLNKYLDEDYLGALINAYLYFISKNIKTVDGVGSAVTEIVNQITQNFHDNSLNLNDLLLQSGYAEDYIRAQFKKFTNKTPNAFLTEIRIKRAIHLIQIYKNSLTLSEICERCGYTDYVYFSKKFKSVTGVSPKRFKEE